MVPLCDEQTEAGPVRSQMPVKTTLATPTPFKGENFPQYVLCRAARNSTLHSDTNEPTTDTEVAPPVANLPTTLLIATANPERNQAPPHKTRVASTGFNKRPLRSPSLRPSLSDQLKSISQGAQAITAQLASTYNLAVRVNAPAISSSSSHGQPAQLTNDKHAFQATTIGLNVGKLECRFPCPVTFSADRCTYLFQHPFEAKEIQMIMYYHDMLHASVNMADHSFRFHLSRVLEQFGSDYNPSNAQHWIRIVLATTSEAKKVKQYLADLKVTDSTRFSRAKIIL
ncbi:hypothetical protein BBJ29_004147 [Phytophthora kernoviae]|uniref:Uncharacterized protein n=1 Tax=Phytophthora kernoviae TaxID=325452 RepID=A0A3F2RMI7_9STRA|nr:hypothetical protein BBJ29_004147 [Phytophthora kernoviae]RLN60557.1 hypothetical protein BBP00_00005910 [Phytophthora kernoviae]